MDEWVSLNGSSISQRISSQPPHRLSTSYQKISKEPARLLKTMGSFCPVAGCSASSRVFNFLQIPSLVQFPNRCTLSENCSQTLLDENFMPPGDRLPIPSRRSLQRLVRCTVIGHRFFRQLQLHWAECQHHIPVLGLPFQLLAFLCFWLLNPAGLCCLRTTPSWKSSGVVLSATVAAYPKLPGAAPPAVHRGVQPRQRFSLRACVGLRCESAAFLAEAHFLKRRQSSIIFRTKFPSLSPLGPHNCMRLPVPPCMLPLHTSLSRAGLLPTVILHFQRFAIWNISQFVISSFFALSDLGRLSPEDDVVCKESLCFFGRKIPPPFLPSHLAFSLPNDPPPALATGF